MLGRTRPALAPFPAAKVMVAADGMSSEGSGKKGLSTSNPPLMDGEPLHSSDCNRKKETTFKVQNEFILVDKL